MKLMYYVLVKPERKDMIPVASHDWIITTPIHEQQQQHYLRRAFSGFVHQL